MRKWYELLENESLVFRQAVVLATAPSLALPCPAHLEPGTAPRRKPPEPARWIMHGCGRLLVGALGVRASFQGVSSYLHMFRTSLAYKVFAPPHLIPFPRGKVTWPKLPSNDSIILEGASTAENLLILHSCKGIRNIRALLLGHFDWKAFSPLLPSLVQACQMFRSAARCSLLLHRPALQLLSGAAGSAVGGVGPTIIGSRCAFCRRSFWVQLRGAFKTLLYAQLTSFSII